MEFELSQEQRDYLDRVEQFARDRVAALAGSIDESGRFPTALVRDAFAFGLAGVTLPREMGGGGRDYVTYAMAIEALARVSATLAAIVVVQSSLVVEPIARFGTAAQKDRWLSKLATGNAIGAFALSEVNAGSDA